MRLSVLIAVAFLAAACGNIGKATPYRASYDGFIGYGSKVTDLGGNRYTIHNNASPISPPETPLEHNMLRAAQLAQEKGFAWFKVINANLGQEGRPVPISMPAITAPVSTITIELLSAPDGDSLAAADTLARLGPKHLN